MKKLIVLAVFLLTSFALNAQELTKFYYPNGNISSEGYIVDNKPDGLWKTYYPDGVLKSIGKRTNFLLDSLWIFFDQKGDTSKIVNYMFDKKNGFLITYYDFRDSLNRQVIKSKELYRNDLKQGISFYYDKKGNLEEEITYKDDKKSGPGWSYKNNQIWAELTFRDNEIISRTVVNRIDNLNRKQGIFRTYYPNHKVKSEKYYKDDKLNGYAREFDQSGKEIKTLRYIDDVLQEEKKNAITSSTSKEKIEIKQNFYPNGKIKSEGGFNSQNKPIGVHRSYNDKGKINGSTTFDNNGNKISSGIVDSKGREQGPFKLYKDDFCYANGNYKNGFREGNWKFYHSNKQLEQEGEYKLGKPHGLWRWYYEDGKIRRQENFDNGKEDGLYFELSQKGDTLCVGEYSEGEKTGLWKTTNGDCLIIENYKFDELNGEYKVYFYPENKVKISANYLNGNLHGDYLEYYSNYKIKEKGTYLNDKKHGSWQYYSEDGFLESTIEYNQDEIRKVDGAKM